MSKLIVKCKDNVVCKSCNAKFDENFYFCLKHKQFYCRKCVLEDKSCHHSAPLHFFFKYFDEQEATCVLKHITEVEEQKKCVEVKND